MFQLNQISILSDAILGCILIFLWLVRRSDRHALLWGGALIAQGTALAIWIAIDPLILVPWYSTLLAVLCTLDLMGLWFGTRHFVGLPARLRASLSGFAITVVVLSGVMSYSPQWGYVTFEILFGPLLIWCGVQVAHGQHHYRLVGWLLILRGALSLSMIGLMQNDVSLEPGYLLGALFRIASTLGLIYAVLDENQQRFRATIGSLSNGFMIGDASGTVSAANDKLAHLLGYATGAELVGSNLTEILPQVTKEEITQFFARLTAPDAALPVIQEELLHLHNGETRPVELVGVPLVERGQNYGLVQVFDIGERIRQRETLQRAANTDALCGLCNRYGLDMRLAQVLTDASEKGEECSLIFLDLDHFNRINDSLGHSAGDKLLIAVAERLQALVGPNDILARFGGDEFIIVQPGLPAGSGATAAGQLARKIKADFASPFNLAPNSVQPISLFVTPSIGIALSPEHGSDPEVLLKGADIAMYAAKAAGRNEVRLFDSSMNDASRDAMRIEEALHQALPNNEFRLVYQPIVSAGDGCLNKVEALIRWHSLTLGFVPPDRFIPVAEESGMIVAIGRWVLQEACRQARQWADRGTGPIRISVNVSAWQLVDSGFLDDVRDALASNQVEPQLLEIELTERVLIEEGDVVRYVLGSLQEMGVSISLDDFGTGYSSLSYLTRFHLDTLKIDRAFVTHIAESERDSALVRAIIAMGHSLGLQIVAEGVETRAQADMLTALGCQSLQGYLFSRPVPPEQILPAPAA